MMSFLGELKHRKALINFIFIVTGVTNNSLDLGSSPSRLTMKIGPHLPDILVFTCDMKQNEQPQLYIIGGPNGAGKTTAAMSLLPELLNCYEYVNADSIAAALSPFAPETTAIQAGRLMLDRINYLAGQRIDFAFETTMASRTFLPLLNKYKKNGYIINAIYFWLLSPTLALERVKHRVLNGGHHIPDDIVLRRYGRSIHNFLNLYAPVADDWTVFDNSFNYPITIAKKEITNDVNIINEQTWNKFRNSYE